MRLRAVGSLVGTAALLFGQAAVVVAPVAAASPVTITADMPGAVPAGHNCGSTIQFAIEGFHTATLLPAGVSAAQDEKKNGIVRTDGDSGHNANGTSHTQLNIPGLSPTNPACGTAGASCTFDGNSVVSSGAPFGPPSGPFVVRVTAAPGTYAFNCRIDPGMSGQLTVVPSGGAVTSPAALATSVHDQVKADVKAGFAAEEKVEHSSHVKNADGTTSWYMTAGTGSPDGHVAVLEFLPLVLGVHPGDTVFWRPQSINEPHTVTFPGELNSDMLPLCEGKNGDTPAVPRKSRRMVRSISAVAPSRSRMRSSSAEATGFET